MLGVTLVTGRICSGLPWGQVEYVRGYLGDRRGDLRVNCVS